MGPVLVLLLLPLPVVVAQKRTPASQALGTGVHSRLQEVLRSSWSVQRRRAARARARMLPQALRASRRMSLLRCILKLKVGVAWGSMGPR